MPPSVFAVNNVDFVVDPLTVVSQIRSAGIPLSISLSQNYPNPFNPTTVISAQWTEQSRVKLVVYDLLGREVSTLANGEYQAGVHLFAFDGKRFASGIYLYRLTIGSLSFVRKMVLMK